MEKFTLKKEGRVFILHMKDRTKGNQLNPPFFQEMGKLLDEIESSEGNASLLLTSDDPKNFSSGADVQLFRHPLKKEAEKYKKNLAEFLVRFSLLAIPVVASAQGHVLGAGACLFLGADIKIMGEKGCFGFPEITHKVTFPESTMEILRLQPDQQAVKKLIFSGEPVRAKQAKEMKFVDEVLPPQEIFEKALKKARALARLDRRIFVRNKRELKRSLLCFMIS